MKKNALTAKQKAKLRTLTREEVVAQIVREHDRAIADTEQGINAALSWIELNPHEPPIDLEKARVSLADLKKERARFIEFNANRGPDEPIETPEAGR